MCELRHALQTAREAAASCFDVPPRKLNVWARGASVRCNAALQMAAQEKRPIAQCAQILIKALANTEAFQSWSLLENGLLASRLDDAWLDASAHALARRCTNMQVNDSREPLFFQTCTLIRARHVLTPLQKDACLAQQERDIAADALRLCQSGGEADVRLIADRLENRLDDPSIGRGDLCTHALAGALNEMLQRARTAKKD